MGLIDYIRALRDRVQAKMPSRKITIENPNNARIQAELQAALRARAEVQPKVRYEPLGEFETSAYNPRRGQTDNTPWLGAWNNDLRKYHQSGEKIVADGSRKFKNGQKLRINGEIYTVRDRMNKRYEGKNNLDFFIPDDTPVGHKKALKHGRQRIPVEAVYDL